MTTDAQTPLAERVLAVLSEERSGNLVAPLSADRCEREPSDGSQVSQRESDMRCWGLAYGLAFGMLESEAPADTDREQLANEALYAARDAFRRWSTEIAPRPVFSSTVDAVLLAYDDATSDLDSVAYAAKKIDRPALMELRERLSELGHAVGVPARELVTA